MKNPNFTTICDCGHTVTAEGIGTGYGTLDGKTTCYACCAISDSEQLKLGNPRKFAFYLTYTATMDDGKSDIANVINWPGTFKHPCRVKFLRVYHNRSGRYVTRADIWFHFEGHNYHGVIGSTDSNQCFIPRKVK